MIDAASFTDVLDAVREQTAYLLGTTIGYDEQDWAAPTRLSGWTRSHVAAHLVENANAMMHLLTRLEGDPVGLYDSPEAQQVALERRALDAGLTLQIELDETSGELVRAFDGLEHDPRHVAITERWEVSVADLPRIRLRELVLHHFDLIGWEALELTSPQVLVSILQLEVERPRRDQLPPVLLMSDEGYSVRLNSEGGDATTVIGPAGDLLVWLSRGVYSSNVSGATGLDLPIQH